MGDSPDMDPDPRPEDLRELVAAGLALVEQRLRAGGQAIHASVRAQLIYIQQTLDAGVSPSPERLDALTLGIYAAREFETSDPKLADVLFEVEYLFKRL